MFSPKWKKDAQHLLKGARKFIDYKRDLLKPERLAEIESRRADLAAAIKEKNLEKVKEASKQLRVVCEKSLPYEKPVGPFEENVEVIFVAVVIALGLRAYYLQPFRIPTGSMQPTLNGIVGTAQKEADWPSLPVRLADKLLRGRTYVKVVAEKDHQIGTFDNSPPIGDIQFLHFFSRSQISITDSKPTFFSRLLGTNPIRLPAPTTPLLDMGLRSTIAQAQTTNGRIAAGTVISEGFVDTGDLVLVDKFSYHFRKPKRGEVFVFDTIGIKGIQERSGPQGAGSHYIKRLCGVPGDSLSIQSPNLLVNGKIAQEPGIQRVIQAQGPYDINPKGYGYAGKNDFSSKGKPLNQYITGPEDTFTLSANAAPGMREYAALGDNTGNSLDSRYWGSVKEFNLVGPALFSLWPIRTGHWGFIR